jgi:hypothetical protein
MEITFQLVITIVGALIFMVFCWQTFSKTDYGAVKCILLLVPFVNLIVMLSVAFEEWPIQRELAELKQRLIHTEKTK